MELKEGWEEIEGVLLHQSLPYVPAIIWTELISRHHDNLLATYFGIQKTRDLIAQNHHSKILLHDVEVYIMRCDLCLTSKAIKDKLYGDLQLLPAPTYCWKNSFMDFVTRLPVLPNEKCEN